MKLRAVAAAAMLLVTTPLAGCAPPGFACPAMMYITPGPVVVETDPVIGVDVSISACLGRECKPLPLDPVETGVRHVPAPSYDGVNVEHGVRVVIRDAVGAIIRDEWHAVPYQRDTPGPCPGPITLQPVRVP